MEGGQVTFLASVRGGGIFLASGRGARVLFSKPKSTNLRLPQAVNSEPSLNCFLDSRDQASNFVRDLATS